MSEAKLQSEIIRWLRDKGFYVIKTKPGNGTPLGCPDIVALLEGFWAALEVKASPKSRDGPLQKETLEKLNYWSFARRVDPTTWPRVKAELEQML